MARELIAAGYAITLLDSLVEQMHGRNGRPSLPKRVDFVCGDVRDPAVVQRALKGVDGVFHLAAEVGVGQSMYGMCPATTSVPQC